MEQDQDPEIAKLAIEAIGKGDPLRGPRFIIPTLPSLASTREIMNKALKAVNSVNMRVKLIKQAPDNEIRNKKLDIKAKF